jgi:hypothetical protein
MVRTRGRDVVEEIWGGFGGFLPDIGPEADSRVAGTGHEFGRLRDGFPSARSPQRPTTKSAVNNCGRHDTASTWEDIRYLAEFLDYPPNGLVGIDTPRLASPVPSPGMTLKNHAVKSGSSPMLFPLSRAPLRFSRENPWD